MIEITRHGAEVIDELEPLWLAMVHHHHAVAPELGPIRPDADTWERRRAHYVEQLAKDGAFVLVAREDGRAVGYALVFVEEASFSWPEPPRWLEVDSLSVLPEARGSSVGKALLDRVRAEGEAAGITELRLYAIAGNADALRFYERLGFQAWLVGLRRPATDDRAPGVGGGLRLRPDHRNG